MITVKILFWISINLACPFSVKRSTETPRLTISPTRSPASLKRCENSEGISIPTSGIALALAE